LMTNYRHDMFGQSDMQGGADNVVQESVPRRLMQNLSLAGPHSCAQARRKNNNCGFTFHLTKISDLQSGSLANGPDLRLSRPIISHATIARSHRKRHDDFGRGARLMPHEFRVANQVRGHYLDTQCVEPLEIVVNRFYIMLGIFPLEDA